MEPIETAFDPLAVFWAIVGWTSVLVFVISALLIAWMIFLPLIPWKQQRRDPFFDRELD